MRFFKLLITKYSLFLEKYYFVFLILTPLVLVLFAILSFVPPIAPDFPDFTDPTKGVEPRGTFTMKRVVTAQDTFEKAMKSGELSCNINSRKKRSVSQFCNIEYFYGAKMVYEAGGADMMDADILKKTCDFNGDILDLQRRSVCAVIISNGKSTCCPSYSLGNYVAQLSRRFSCHDITPSDVATMKSLLVNCSAMYFSGKLETASQCSSQSECRCLQHRYTIQTIFRYLVDKDYMRTSNILKNTMILSPLDYSISDSSYFGDIYTGRLSGSFPLRSGNVELVAFDFPDFKFDEFNRKLLVDAVFPVIGLACIALILLLYTHSFFIMFMTVFSVISSVIMAYFVYHHIFQLEFFPFLNVVTFVFLVGIGADDAFVFSDTWDQSKQLLPHSSLADWMDYTLRHAALSMLVTSLTTSSAFYANFISDITAIRLFGVYAGTSILINYTLMITWFPAGMIALERWNRRRARTPAPNHVIMNDLQSPVADNQNCDMANAGTAVEVQQPLVVDRFPRYAELRRRCSQAFQRFFDHWIPKALTVFPMWILALFALGIGMLCAILVSPGLQRPKSKDFQVFSSSHPLEQYDLKYKKLFRADDKAANFQVYMFFGVKAVDNGDHLVPTDFGELEYDPNFSIEPAANQKWLVELCSRIRQQPFFDKTARWSCFPEDFQRTCSANGNNKFPFDSNALTACLANNGSSFCTYVYMPAIFFDQNNNLRSIVLTFPTNEPYTTEYDVVNRLWDKIGKFTDEVIADAPIGLEHGWSVTWLRFFALQKNLGTSTLSSLALSLGIAFLVILLTSINWVISVYAIITIFFILCTTVGSLVLAGWELNILESIVISVAVGLSVDFTLHYGVSYTLSPDHGRVEQVKFAFSHIGPAVTLASITTFIAGVFMMFSTVLVYFQLGQFLTLVMAVSWFYATFFFMAMCYAAGPVGFFGQINKLKCYSCKIQPTQENHE